jgi:hypothetical protein
MNYVYATSRPAILCRWWLKTRVCKSAIQINSDQGIPAVREFYIPIYAWPLELLYRLFFGKAILREAK